MRKSLISLTLLFVIASLSLGKASFTSQTTTIRYLDLPYNSMPMGITYNPFNDMVYVALRWNGSIAEINTTDYSYTLYPLTSWHSQYSDPMPWCVTVDSEGNVWITIRDFKTTPNKPPADFSWNIAKFNISNKTISYIKLHNGVGCSHGILFYNGYIWVLGQIYIEGYIGTCGLLTKIEPTNDTVIANYILSYAEYIPGIDWIEYIPEDLKGDGDSLWISLLEFGPDRPVYKGKLIKFDTTTENITLTITGLNRPLGIEQDNNYVYVAENSVYMYNPQNGTIAKIDKQTLEITRILTPKILWGGPCYLLRDSHGYLWYTDNSGHLGIVGGLTYSSKAYCYFITEIPHTTTQTTLPDTTEIWFSCVGSAYLGIKDSWELLGDINKDGKVDMVDIGTVAHWFGYTVPPALENVDINKDGKIDMVDVGTTARNFGQTL